VASTVATQVKIVETLPAAVPTQAAVAQVSKDAGAMPTKKPKIDLFSDWDWTWLNGNPRNKDVAFDSKFFTPEIRADITYNYDFNKPIDNSIAGSSEIFRANEIQLERLGIGGDFHYDNVRARFMTQFGNYSETTPRNDPSPAKGQWDLDTANRYIAEAYGGYHINALSGINIGAGIFLSYIGGYLTPITYIPNSSPATTGIRPCKKPSTARRILIFPAVAQTKVAPYGSPI
jgi:Putative beta-barrel porin-2, OmpL-like. bbp2